MRAPALLGSRLLMFATHSACVMTVKIEMIVGIFVAVTQAEWAANLGNLLPSAAGARLYAYPTEAFVDPMQLGTPLEPWQGALVLLVWLAALFTLASVLLKRRDA